MKKENQGGTRKHVEPGLHRALTKCTCPRHPKLIHLPDHRLTNHIKARNVRRGVTRICDKYLQR